MHREGAPMDLEHRFRPTAAGMMQDMFIWPTNHVETIKGALLPNFSEVVLVDRLRPQMDHRQCARPQHAKRSLRTRRAMPLSTINTCKAISIINT